MKRRQVFKIEHDDCVSEISILTKGDGRNHKSPDIEKRHFRVADLIHEHLAGNYHFTRIKVK